MQEKISNIAITQIVARLKRVLNVSTDSELAERLGVKQNTISSWKSRGSLDYALIIAKCDSVDLNWLFNGESEKKSENFSAENVHPKCPPNNVHPITKMSTQNKKSGRNWTPEIGCSFSEDGDSDEEQIVTSDQTIKGLRRDIDLRDALLASKDELLAAKDQTIATQNNALKLLEGQINASTSLIEKLTEHLGNDVKKHPKHTDARDASDVDAPR